MGSTYCDLYHCLKIHTYVVHTHMCIHMWYHNSSTCTIYVMWTKKSYSSFPDFGKIACIMWAELGVCHFQAFEPLETGSRGKLYFVSV